MDLQALFPWITSARLTTICLGEGIDTNALGINIGQLVSGLVDAKENESKQDAGNILDGIGDIIGSIGGGTTAKSGS